MCTIAFVLVSCDDDTLCTMSDELLPLEGHHSLTSIYCECPFIEITPFQQQWKFNFEKSKIDVIVVCDIGADLIFDQGTYDFKLLDTVNSWGGDDIKLEVNNRDFYIDILEDKILLRDLGADFDAGAYYEFSKN